MIEACVIFTNNPVEVFLGGKALEIVLGGKALEIVLGGKNIFELLDLLVGKLHSLIMALVPMSVKH